MTLRVRPDKLPFTTGIVTEQLFSSSQLLAQITGEGVQSNKAIVGRNAFAHEAGIHQDGILKDRRTYEIMRPEDVGVPETTLVLGKHSGRHALKNRCTAIRIEPTRLELDELYKRMIALADRKKTVRDHDLLELWSAMKRASSRAKAPAVVLFREEAVAADEAGYGHGV